MQNLVPILGILSYERLVRFLRVQQRARREAPGVSEEVPGTSRGLLRRRAWALPWIPTGVPDVKTRLRLVPAPGGQWV